MKEKWLMANIGSWNDIKSRITTALESGFDCVVVDSENVLACKGARQYKDSLFLRGERSPGLYSDWQER